MTAHFPYIQQSEEISFSNFETLSGKDVLEFDNLISAICHT